MTLDEEPTLNEIIRMAVFAADDAVLGRKHRTQMDAVGAAVDAAIRAAVANGVLVVAEDADAKLAAGFTIRFQDHESSMSHDLEMR